MTDNEVIDKKKLLDFLEEEITGWAEMGAGESEIYQAERAIGHQVEAIDLRRHVRTGKFDPCKIKKVPAASPRIDEPYEMPFDAMIFTSRGRHTAFSADGGTIASSTRRDDDAGLFNSIFNYFRLLHSDCSEDKMPRKKIFVGKGSYTLDTIPEWVQIIGVFSQPTRKSVRERGQKHIDHLKDTIKKIEKDLIKEREEVNRNLDFKQIGKLRHSINLRSALSELTCPICSMEASLKQDRDTGRMYWELDCGHSEGVERFNQHQNWYDVLNIATRGVPKWMDSIIKLSELTHSMLDKRLRGGKWTKEEEALLEHWRYGSKPIDTIDDEIRSLIAIAESEGL